MTDNLLSRYLTRTSDGAEGANLAESTPEDYGSFGWLRGVKERSIMLELRKKQGTILAVGYSWLERAVFDPSDGITLWVAGQKIQIIGHRLHAEVRPQVRLFDGILRHRVPWIQEADQSTILQPDPKQTLIEEIKW